MNLISQQFVYSLYNNNNQERMDIFQNKQTSLSIETFQSVLENKFLNNYYSCSSLLKRITNIHSLSNYSKRTLESISEEQTNTIDYDNTYFSSEDLTKLDDISSFTTITANNSLEEEEEDTSNYSNTETFSEENKHINTDYSNLNINDKDEVMLTSSNSNFLGLNYLKPCRNTQQTITDFDLIDHYCEQNQSIRSSIDNVSLNSSMTMSIPFNDKQLNKQKEKRTKQNQDDSDDEYYIIGDQHKSLQQLTMNNNQNDIDEDDATRLFDNGQHDGMYSDESQYSDALRYSSKALTNDDISHASSILRQEAISITKVRCKQRESWLNSSSKNFHKPLISNNQVGGTKSISSSSSRNTNMNSTTPLHNNSIGSNNKNVQTRSYDFDEMKTNETVVSPLSQTNNNYDKDAVSSTTNKKTNNFYLIHHQSSLVPIKDLLKKNFNSNIEIIQMDEQDCILEIVDGVVTLVPKHKSAVSSSNSDEEKSEEQQKNSYEYETSNNYDSPEREKRSLSRASTISTPSISENEHEREHEQEEEQERDEISSASSSRLLSNKEEEEQEQVQEPFILLRDNPSKSPPILSQTDRSVDLLDLFSTPPVPLSNSNTNNNIDKHSKNLLEDSLSSISSYEPNNNDDNNNSTSESSEKVKDQKQQQQQPPQQPPQVRSVSPIQNQSKISSPPSPSKDELPTNKKSSSIIDETDVEYPIPKSEPPPAAKPINKARINEFASLLSSAVHLTQPPPPLQVNTKSETPKIPPSSTNRSAPSPARSEDQSYSSIPSATSDREERESYHTVKSNTNSELDQPKKPIDARYNEKIDDRKNIHINTSNIKALFEQKISDTNKALAQSNEHLLHLTENRQQQQHQHKKVPNSYLTVKRNLPNNTQQMPRRQSFQDSSNTNKYNDHSEGTKDVVIEDKQPEPARQTQHYASNMRRNNTEEILRPGVESLTIPNGYYSESLIAREIRQTKEKEEELKQQRKRCGLPEDAASFLTVPNTDSNRTEQTKLPDQPVKNSSFLSNLDFFTTKVNETNSSRRATTSIQNLVYDSSHGNEEKRTNVFQETNRFNNNNSNIPVVRINSANNTIQRSASNQNFTSAQNTNNIIQREIEAIRAKEAELRQLGRIQRTSDDHSDPRKYQELVPPLPKSQSTNILPTGKVKKDTERFNGPITATSNGILKPKTTNNTPSTAPVRGRFPTPNPTAPVVGSSNKTIDYSKLTAAERFELERRECQEREQELRKQRNSIGSTTLSVNSTMNGDSGNVSQDEHDDDHEHYLKKIERLKQTENEKAHAPLVRPTKKSDLSQRWEQMMANKNNTTGEEDEDDDNNNNNNNTKYF